MRDGFIKVAAATPDILVADCAHNRQQIVEKVREMSGKGAKIMVLPELCLTGYTCGDLFWQDTLIRRTEKELKLLQEELKDTDGLIVFGLPVRFHGKLYDVAAVLNRGKILGFVPKHGLSCHEGESESRYFLPGGELEGYIEWQGEKVPFGQNLLFRCEELPELCVAAELSLDLWMAAPPSISHAGAGALVIVNPSAEAETVGRASYRRDLVKGQSGRLLCAYICASAGNGESSSDFIFGSQNLIAENGKILKESTHFENETIYGDIDLEMLEGERRRNSLWNPSEAEPHGEILFHLNIEETELIREFPISPFIPEEKEELGRRCEEILNMQALGLKKRLEHTHCTSAVLGISGGLDSTLALLVTARAFDLCGIDRKNIVAVTMPCFGTTDRTYTNACELTRRLGAVLREVDIKKAVLQHFEDIGHDPADHSVTYENSQARERTQVIMDIANGCGGMVIGTGDLSELALGWATYNGDHMSMYGVNGAIPKTLVRHLVAYYADTCGKEELASILRDVLDTPVSPELLPPEDGKISQKTEDLVGPYELHDFFLYYILRFHFGPAKIYRMAKKTFCGMYEEEVIEKWLRKFYWRFFSQQFKRSCLPDGPKVGSVGVSPRGDLHMPSDACVRVWIDEFEQLQEEKAGV